MVNLTKFSQFMSLLLQKLQWQGEVAKHAAFDQEIKKFGLNVDQLADEFQTTVKPRARDRIDWASSCLKNAAAVSLPRRGFIALGANFEKFLAFGDRRAHV